MLRLFTQGFMAEPKRETGEKNVLYIQGCDDLISTEMCGRKIIHELGLISVASHAFSLQLILWFLLHQFFIDPMKLLPLARFLPKPPGQKGEYLYLKETVNSVNFFATVANVAQLFKSWIALSTE